ncbi:helix-turn-helix domain-containing protein [Roseomonas sp. HJA6]|uniref:Helix-turn-helix domain-containing protein n=1 Tax=Roseomonas alba TaxID=2846776 RepID=A0ABS7AHE9_9PROT|nr:helix-turn-helix domain-containing protein [Neoroseomonas alba]MBW6401736.1 helix-turn-helix domain-containing protein [Neoroseomonas alba]
MQADTAPLVRFQAADDMDAMAQALTGGHADFVPLRSGRFDGRFCEVNLGGTMIRHILHGPMLMLGAVRAGHVSLQFAPRAQSLLLNGVPLTVSDLGYLRGGEDLQVRFAAPQERVGIIIPDDAFDAALEEHDVKARSTTSRQVLPLRAGLAERTRTGLIAITDFAERFPEHLATPGLAAALAEECRRLIAGAFAATDGPGQRPCLGPGVIDRVRRADEFLRANIARPIYSDEICAAIGVVPRTLHQSFISVYGMAPATYLKRRRLLLVRRALMAARDGRTLVKSIALAHGFWHLGRFARDYAAMFGEAPSVTLGRGARHPPLVSARLATGGLCA